MYHYELEFGSYYLKDDETGNIIFMTDEIAIAFDKDGFVLLKHGNPDLVNKWLDDYRKKLIESESPILQEMVGNLVVIQGKFPVDEINRVIDTTGYIEILAKKYNWLDQD